MLAPILSPFVFAALLGWLGDPMVDRLERKGFKRNNAVILVFSAMTLVLVIALIVLVPMLEQQIVYLVESLPNYRDWMVGTALPWVEQRTGLPHRELLPDALARLQRCDWRGNVRELQNMLEKVAMLSDTQQLSAADFDGVLPSDSASPEFPPSDPAAAPLDRNAEGSVAVLAGGLGHAEAMAAFERTLLLEALAACSGQAERAAQRLGLARATFYRKLQAHGIKSQY